MGGNKKNIQNSFTIRIMAFGLVLILALGFGFFATLYISHYNSAYAGPYGEPLRFGSPPVDTSASRVHTRPTEPEKRVTQPERKKRVIKAEVKRSPKKAEESVARASSEETEKLEQAETKKNDSADQALADNSGDARKIEKAEEKKDSKDDSQGTNPQSVYIFNTVALFPKPLNGVYPQWERVVNLQKKK